MIFLIELKFGRSVANVDRQFVIARMTVLRKLLNSTTDNFHHLK